MAKKEIEIGPAGQAVAAHLAQVRRMLGKTQAEVSEAANAQGRALTPASIGEIERLARRVDVDDFVALCRALGRKPAQVIEAAELDLEEEMRRLRGDEDARYRDALERLQDAYRAGGGQRTPLPREIPGGYFGND